MSIEVNIDLSGFNRKFSSTNLINARRLAASDAMQAMNVNYVPMLHTDSNTNLRALSQVNSDGSNINYNAVYARAQFYGFVGKEPGHRVYKYTTPGTSRRWDLRLKGNQQMMNAIIKTFVKGADLNG